MRLFYAFFVVVLITCSCAGTGTVANGPPTAGGGGTPTSGGDADDAGTLATGSNGDGAGSGTSDDAGSNTDAGSASADDGSVTTTSDGSATGDGPYANPGPNTVTTATFSITSPNATYTTTAYIPSGAGANPVVILSSGFFQTAIAYAAYANRLASWGVVTLTRDDPNVGEATANVVADVTYEVTTWLASQNTTSTSALYGKIDSTRIGLAGHSRGGQVSLLAAEGLAGKVKAVFGLDPVDTTTAPEASTSIATIGMPLAFIGETTDNASSGCAPADVDFLTLYGDAVTPAVAITVPNADHTMFEDPSNCFACTLCTQGTANQALVESTAVRYLTAFFARELLGDATVGAAFAGAGANQDVAAGTIQIQSK
jgi:dienelactone hydrolase